MLAWGGCRTIAALVVIVGTAIPAARVNAGASPASLEVSGPANPPIGHVSFCARDPGECRPYGAAGLLTLTSELWNQLNEINFSVNRSIAPVTDLDYYDLEELWTLPDGYGDCEDYALLKRSRLVAAGWPTSALLVAVVFDEVGEGHAVLLAHTDRGDFVLDNKTDVIRAWYDTAYQYVKRQDEADPRRWVLIGDPRWTTRATAAPR